MSDAKEWNPRYLAYVRANGRTDPDEQLAADRAEWPGGCMCGFILWMKERHGEAMKAIPGAYLQGGWLIGHAEFDAWLESRVDELLGNS